MTPRLAQADFLSVHLNGGVESAYRPETLMVPNLTIVVLRHLIQKYLDETGIVLQGANLCYDQGVESHVKAIETALSQLEIGVSAGRQQVLMATGLMYNMHETEQLFKTVKERFGSQVITVLGGQLVSQYHALSDYFNISNNAYQQFADIVTIGEGELLIPELLQGIESGNYHALYHRTFSQGSTTGKLPSGKFSTVGPEDWKAMIGLPERLIQQKHEMGFTQLSFSGQQLHGCSWAIANRKACEFCALQNVTTKNETTLYETLETLFQIAIAFPQVHRYFDISNQFLPYGKKQVEAFLEEYEDTLKKLELKYEIKRPELFVYLTLPSIQDIAIVKKLYDIGVRQVYLGLEHFDASMVAKMDKPAKRNIPELVFRGLNNLKAVGIRVNGGFVLGSPGETLETLQHLQEGIDQLIQLYVPNNNPKELFEQIGIYPLEIIPGAAFFAKFYKETLSGAVKNEGQGDVFERFFAQGYLSRDDQHLLSQYFMETYCPAGYDAVMCTAGIVRGKLKQAGLLAYTVDEGS